MLFGRWTLLGTVGAALIFSSSDAAPGILLTLNVPIPSNILPMAPYLATNRRRRRHARARPPRADGKPHIKQ